MGFAKVVAGASTSGEEQANVLSFTVPEHEGHSTEPMGEPRKGQGASLTLPIHKS